MTLSPLFSILDTILEVGGWLCVLCKKKTKTFFGLKFCKMNYKTLFDSHLSSLPAWRVLYIRQKGKINFQNHKD